MPLKPGLYDAALAVDDLNRLHHIRGHCLQNLGGVLQCYILSRIVLQRDIPGDFVECGVAAGGQLAAMAQAMKREKKLRTIHAFDSFDGIPHAGPKDDQQPGLNYFPMERDLPLRDRLVSTQIAKCDLASCQSLWKTWNLDTEIKWYPGWFQDTLPGIQMPPIAFLRLDGDLYESTECCLRNLYDFVSPGGLVFIDDYGLGGCFRAVHEFLQSRNLPDSVLMADIDGNAGACYWFK